MATATKTKNDDTDDETPDALAENDTRGAVGGDEAELRKDAMMAHLLDSLEAGTDIGTMGSLCLSASPATF